jgi:hypothetical protein
MIWNNSIYPKGKQLSQQERSLEVNQLILIRTTLQVEPVLGGKKVDLYKLFQSVINSGGFDQASEQ